MGSGASSVLAREFGTFFRYEVTSDQAEAAAADLKGINLRYYVTPNDAAQDSEDALTLNLLPVGRATSHNPAMTPKDIKPNDSGHEVPFRWWIWAVFLVVVLWLLSYLLITEYSGEGVTFLGDRGTFGDMFGAVNALFSGLAFATLIYTVLQQPVARFTRRMRCATVELVHREMSMRIMQSYLPLLLVATSCLTACGGGSSTDAAPPPAPTAAQTISAMEARGDLPTLDRSAPLKGADLNADGVRDDLERYIAALPDTTSQKSSLRQLAKSIDSTLVADTTNSVALRAASSELTDSINCVWSVYPTESAPKKVEEIRRLAVNTRERYNAYAKYNQARSGAVIALPSGGTCK